MSHNEMVLAGALLVLLVARRPRTHTKRSKGFLSVAAIVIESAFFFGGLILVLLGLR